MNVTQAGIGSGLDLESLIEAFVTAESVPQEIRLQQKEDRINTELSGIGSFKSALSTFQTAAEKLASADDFYEQTVDVSNDDISVTTNGFATNGSFSIEVIQLAEATRLQTADFTDSETVVGAGSLTFTSANGDTFDVAIDATDDLSAIRDKINEESTNFGVNVTLVNHDGGTFLSYSTSETGTDNALTVTTADTDLDTLATTTETNAAQNGIIEIDGNVVTSSSNEFKNNIEDVTIVANQVTASGAATLDIAQDTSVASTLINEFVAGYNAMIENLIGLGAPVQGRLAFDADVRSMKNQLSNIVTDTVSSITGDFNSLGSIGVLVNAEGKLEISTVGIGTIDSGADQLSDAITNNLDEVGAIFATSDGVISQITELIDSYNDSDGSLTQRQTSLNLDLTGISEDYETLEARLRDYEATLRSRFSFLDSTVAGFNATSTFLTSALAPIKKD
ncbi:MAG: flagellar filament capping protein FliD [Colwellia sp.]|nr:flagellar filament capping protein FliD [Colwellia sp.]